jgi:HlyD family secretion protein
MIRFLRNVSLPILALAALTLAIVNVAGNYVKIAPPPPPSPPPVAPFDEGVAGTGIVEPRTENIAIGSQVSGVVTKVHVKVNQRVAKGAPLFTIDDRQLQSVLRSRQAELRMAQAALTRLEKMPRPEELIPSAAKISEAVAYLAAQDDLRKRAAQLGEHRAMSTEEVTARDMAWRARKEQLARLEAEDALLKAGAWEPDKEVGRAAVAKAQADVDQALTDIERLTVRAPIDGDVLQVNVRAGEFVNLLQTPPPMIFGDLSTLHMRVDIDDHDIPRFSPQARARAIVRGDSRRSYPMTLFKVEPYVVPKKSLTGDSSERVDTRVLQAVYALEPGERSVYVGQQLDVYIDAAPGK